MEVASFYAALLYFYNRYRQGQDQYLYAAILAGALTFYTHGLGQILAGLTGLMFFISDFRYHFQKERRETMYIAMGLVILCILPYLRYNLDNFDTIPAQIRQRGSYWMDGNFTLTKKIAKFFEQYSLGINPLFWFFPNSIDIVRHKMLGYGNIHLFLLPFAIAGMVKSVINFRKPEYRTILITFFVSPIPATVVAIGTPRVLWMIIPWVILIALGFNWFAVWISTRKPIIKFSIINWAVFITLALTSGFMLRDAIVNGPLWFKDYGLYGMQYGAKQVFQDTVARELKNNPNIKFIISPSWANGTDQFASFFVPPDLLKRVQFGTPNDLYNNPTWLTPGSIFIITTDEFSNFSKDARFKNLQVQETIPFPDGKPGFYLVTLKFADNIDEIMAAEHEARRKPVEGHVMINGQTTRILHSPIGGGNIQDSFDDNPDTLTRVVEANPYVFELNPSTPIVTHSITIQTGSLSDFTVTISLYAPGSSVPEIYTQTFQDLPPDPLVIVEFDNGPASSERIYIEIKDNTSGETSQIHVRTIAFK
jgi:hypothetical protein